jgi:photosystem I subunit 8
MTAAYLPSILVPLIGLIFPGFVMAFAFIYIEQEEVS